MSDETRDAARKRYLDARKTTDFYERLSDSTQYGFELGFWEGFDAGADWASSRTCVWTWDVRASVFRSECDDRWGRRKFGAFCQGCGGKIVEKR